MNKLLFIAILLWSVPMYAQYSVGGKATFNTALKNANFAYSGVDNDLNPSTIKNIKGLIVVFTCNSCPFARAYEARINELHKEFAPQGYPVIAINANDADQKPADTYEQMKKRAKEHDFTFPYLHDPDQQMAKVFGATRTPHVFILQNKTGGDFYLRYKGAIDDNAYAPEDVKEQYAAQAVQLLLKGNRIPREKTHTKAIGCSIKWKGE